MLPALLKSRVAAAGMENVDSISEGARRQKRCKDCHFHRFGLVALARAFNECPANRSD
jgi:hypothetical protein